MIWGLVFGAVPPGGAQEKTKAQEAAKKTDAAAEKPGTQAHTARTGMRSEAGNEKSGWPLDGIKVHGHWTIVVRDGNGKEVDRRDFENGPTDTGKSLLVDSAAH